MYILVCFQNSSVFLSEILHLDTVVWPTLFYPLLEPCVVEKGLIVRACNCLAFKRILQAYFPTLLLAEQSSDNRALLLPRSMSRDMIGDGEKDERVQLDMKTGV